MPTLEFLIESNKIEGITRKPTIDELMSCSHFVNLSVVDIQDLISFVGVSEPGARLRDQPGMDVRVGQYYPPAGGQHIIYALQELLEQINIGEITPYAAHVAYETLHPFTDGNGRSGRILWAWHMARIGQGISLGFLHTFYYQSLSHSRL